MRERMVAAVNELLDAMSAALANREPSEVIVAFDYLEQHFCRHCGSRQPDDRDKCCPCNNDE